MHARVWILALSILIIGPVHSQSPVNQSVSNLTTGGHWNGRYWRTLSTNEKTSFMAGYSNAVESVAAVLIGGDFEHFKRTTAIFLPSLTIGEITRALDLFYETPENGPIGITNALHVIASRASGTDAATIEQMVNDMRATAAKAK